MPSHDSTTYCYTAMVPKQKQVERPEDWWGRKIEPGEHVALVLDQHGPMFIPVISPPEHIEQVAGCVTVPDGGSERRRHPGFGAFPSEGDRPVLPMRLEFAWSTPDEPVEAVFDLDHGLIGRYRFTVDVDGTVRFLKLVVGPAADAPSDSDPLRRLNLGLLREQLNAWLRHPFVVGSLGRALAVPRRRPGRRASDPVVFAVWAANYVQALKVDDRRPGRVIVEQAAAVGEHVTFRQVNNAVRRARDLGMLTQAPVGKAGGELTALAKGLLRDNGLDENGRTKA
jgi:hypothetical protein